MQSLTLHKWNKFNKTHLFCRWNNVFLLQFSCRVVTLNIKMWKSHNINKKNCLHNKQHCFPFGLIWCPHILINKESDLLIRLCVAFRRLKCEYNVLINKFLFSSLFNSGLRNATFHRKDIYFVRLYILFIKQITMNYA